VPIITTYPFKKNPLNKKDEILISDYPDGLKTKTTNLKALGSFNNVSFDFTQGIPSATWTINHDLDKFPSVTVVNESKEVMIGNITYIDKDNITITFSAPFSGYAYKHSEWRRYNIQ
jgi:hypothetical protein